MKKTLNLKLALQIVFWIVLAGYLTTCNKEQADLSALAKEPPHTNNQYKFRTTDSHISTAIKIPYSVIKAAIKKALKDFETVPLNGTIDCSIDKTIKLGPIKKTVHIPCTSSYEGLLHIEQAGSIQVSKVGNAKSLLNKLTVTAPIKVYGKVGLRGKAARKLGLSNKNVDATITVTIILDFGLKTNWDVYANINVKHTWNTPPRIEIIRGKYITFTKQADQYIAKKLNDIPQQINTMLANLKLKNKILKAWKPYVIPFKKLALTNKEAVNLVIIPKQAVISNIQYTDKFLNLTVGIKIATGIYLGSKVSLPKVGPPQLSKIKASQPLFKLILPVYVSYKLIKQQLNKAIAGKSFSKKTDAGIINILVQDVYVYPSDKKLVIGVKFKADVNGELLKTTGKLFLVSKPVINKLGRELSLTQVSFSREFNNTLLNAITYVFKTKINNLIEEKARFNLTKTIKKTLTLMQRELSSGQKNTPFRISLNNPKLRVTQLVMGDEQLILEARLTGLVNLQPRN